MGNQASEDELRANIDKALHIDWAFNKSKPTKIIIDGSATKGAYHTSYDLFVDNILDLIRTEKIKLLDKIVGIASNKQFKDYTKQDIASFFSRLGETSLDKGEYLGKGGVDQALKELEAMHQQEIAKAREQAIEDVKYAGYGYDDGTGFVLKISYAELATLKEHKEAK